MDPLKSNVGAISVGRSQASVTRRKNKKIASYLGSCRNTTGLQFLFLGAMEDVPHVWTERKYRNSELYVCSIR